jgi:hypothetical protein
VSLRQARQEGEPAAQQSADNHTIPRAAVRAKRKRPARAHEAEAVNEIKRKQLFTVVIGNPPYSINSCNLQESAVENVTITIDSFGAVTP